MYWDKGNYLESDLQNTMEDGCYVFWYSPEEFYAQLIEFIGGDTVDAVRRYLQDFPLEVTIEAGGEKLQHYIYVNDPVNGIPLGDNDFSLIDGGFGVFSSRMTVKHGIRLAGNTVPELMEMPHYGFKYIGGK